MIESVVVFYLPEQGLYEMTAEQCAFAYRSSYFQTHPGCVILSAVLRLQPGDPEEIAARMKELSEKRLSFAGLRTCGSVFKNPPAPSPTAGQLSDRAFCKGLRVGGAHVAARHGNVISADGTATPSDVQALLHLVADRVFASSGVLLEPELRILR